MSIMTLVIGQSGTGKTTSLRNLPPDKAFLFKVIDKPLPFKRNGLKHRTRNTWHEMHEQSGKAVDAGYKIIIIDDFQYLLATEFMARASEKGYEKFTELANHAWQFLNFLSSLPNDVRVYILSHSEESEGQTKLKTIGKLLDEKLTPEGLFTIVLKTMVTQGVYEFATNNSGSDTVKSPMGLFDGDRIPNDLNEADKAICDYYEINTNTAT